MACKVSVAVLHKQMDIIDGSCKTANPVRPNAFLKPALIGRGEFCLKKN